MQEIRMTLFMVPVAKGRPRLSNKGGFARAYTPKKTAVAENNLLAQALPFKPEKPLQAQARVWLNFFMPIPKSMSKKDRILAIRGVLAHTKKPDLDNLEKLVLDALNGVFYRDDSIIHSVTKSKCYSERPCIEILIQGE